MHVKFRVRVFFFLLLLLALLVGAALVILSLRVPKTVSPDAAFALLSRETLVLFGNVLLLIATATVLLGTLYPLILDALGQGKVSVGPPYFNAVFVPLMVPVLFLLGVAPFTAWQGASGRELQSRLQWLLLAAVCIGPVLVFAYEELRWPAVLACVLAVWIVLTSIAHLRVRGLSLRTVGMALAHVGVAIGIIGIGMVTAFEREQTLTMRAGESAAVLGYQLQFKGIVEEPGPNYSAVRGRVAVLRGDRVVSELFPEKRIYHASKMPMTESAIDYGLFGDLYVVLGDPLSLDTWTLRVFFKPFISWIWGGALTMALGGLLAALARRRQSAEGVVEGTAP